MLFPLIHQLIYIEKELKTRFNLMQSIRLDQKLVSLGLVRSRSQALSYIKLGYVKVNNEIVLKPGYLVNNYQVIELLIENQYVGRAALKLESADKHFKINFKDKTVLDVGSSTGGFTDFAIRNGAKKVLAVDVGTDQLDPRLRFNEKVEVYEKTDIREFNTNYEIDIILIDVSFISFRKIATSIYNLSSKNTLIYLMAKPQFETTKNNLNSAGVIKNSQIRRQIFKDLEQEFKTSFKILKKIDSDVPGKKGNLEKFYFLKKI